MACLLITQVSCMFVLGLTSMVRLPQGFSTSNRAISNLTDHKGFLSQNHKGFLLVAELSQCCVMLTREYVAVNETKVLSCMSLVRALCRIKLLPVTCFGGHVDVNC